MLITSPSQCSSCGDLLWRVSYAFFTENMTIETGCIVDKMYTKCWERAVEFAKQYLGETEYNENTIITSF